MTFEKPYIVLPTYNERENLERLIPTLFSLRIPNLQVLVVDDSSPDGTKQFVINLQPRYPALSILNRPKKEGLGRAYVAGFKEVLGQGADCIVQMDSDFSHDPQDVPRLIEGLKDTDLAIGSRYTKGGGTKNWPFHRIALSKWGNIYARFVTGAPIADLTAGFKAWKSRCLKAIQLETVNANGYGFQIEATFRTWKSAFRIKEVPIMFTERRIGQSKMNRKIIAEALWLVWKLRFLLLFLTLHII
ncbi:MAG: hypothetical protein A3F82_10235 [Deltaproteobacteria bacterium RIFCSPLOWO2_12_FULL_44_12]|nr:MAG: hypothetical protein A2712_00095 [Deltaproteobacteria bacterium RIFCSPHIGHO2_01_FULL_43_49]OGQ15820.1 MAG: hypothetical protein A3D22_02745 [Deltaproteobacteria bacterium RIFCSPHIGHO2_02_FULL_44_53]OGQ28774.1 MAG: hypothetical protein A3D98_01075 [Deltaproteobacteria bacterium RIFCSPHIGHO2_12_FULL_44_21]OGQ32094.1 MAG: hypothetical protein A2979_03200 [Deltaproteobacteria bacterium RIFCSPLOWO2_01_FULL_45_74]OGQ43762.1 MAG: hypothetical protein A3I70_05785 [Deltaproteobacteria bacterium 